MAEIEHAPTERGGWLTLAITVLVCFGLAEIAIRYVPPDISVLGDMILLVDDPVGYRMKPHLDVAFDGLFAPLPETVRWQTNAQGYRRDGLVEAATSQRRVATFGDSETFGWSVAIADTYQNQLEQAANDLEVLNFGVPGYNTTNVALAMADLVPRYSPEVIVYLFNKNDFDPPIEVAATFFRSHLLGRIRYLWQIWVKREERKRIRESMERKLVAAADLAQMAEVASSNRATLVIAFMRWRNWQELRPVLGPDHPVVVGEAAGSIRIVNAEPALNGVPELDDHLAPAAYRNLAALLCEAALGCESALSD